MDICMKCVCVHLFSILKASFESYIAPVLVYRAEIYSIHTYGTNSQPSQSC